MINNDIRRSVEFFNSPVQAGRAATNRPFDLHIIILIFALCAIVTVLSNYYSFTLLFAQNPELLNEPIFQLYRVLLASPLRWVFLQFAALVMFSLFIFRIGSAFNGDLDLKATLSALARWTMVRTFLAAGISFVAEGLSLAIPSIAAILSTGATIYLFCLTVPIANGILNFTSIPKTIGVIIAALFITIFMLVPVTALIGVKIA